MREVTLAGQEFLHIDDIVADRNPTGALIEHRPHLDYKNPEGRALLPYGEGPFCCFKAAQQAGYSGLFLITVNTIPTYLGRSRSIKEHFGHSQIGKVSPVKCFAGGQATNIRLNALILDALKKQQTVSIYGHRAPHEVKSLDQLKGFILASHPLRWNLLKHRGTA